MADHKSSKRWLREHFSDPYVKAAQKSGFRSRAVFKLKELQEKYRLLKPGMTIIDLGAAPGSWSQYAADLVKPKGCVIALDCLEMPSIEGVKFIQGDFTEESVMQELLHSLTEKKADWVLSDMAPNMSGVLEIDVPKSMHLTELALDFALQVLHKEGGFLIKVFQGEGFDQFLSNLKNNFQKVSVKKPKASRGRSRELYVLARFLKK